MFTGKQQGWKYKAAARLMMLMGVLGNHAFAQAPGDAPLIFITTPVRNQTYTDNIVTATVHFRGDADVSTFHAQLNGNDVTSSFQQTSNCTSGICDQQAFLSGDGFLHGANVLTVEVSGPDTIVADDRAKFDYEGPFVQNEPVSKLVPSVAVSSVRLEPGKPVNDYKSYDIVVGPGAGFPQTVYRGADLNCTAGNDSVQVLVLQRKTLAPENTNSRKCFGDASSLANFLAQVQKNDLVILNNFMGRMLNIDTRAIGGTNYAGTTINTSYYTAIGVAGAAPGTAHESYQPDNSHTARHGVLVPLNGSLMLDTALNYSYTPKDFLEIKVNPGTDGNCASVTTSYERIPGCLGPNSLGAFLIAVVDRRTGNITDSYYLDTNSNDAAERAKAVGDMTWLMCCYYKPNDLMVITTIGTPFRDASQVTGGLWTVFMQYGGIGFNLPKLTTAGSAYTLITSNDPAYVSGRYARENTTVSGNGTGKLDLVFAKNRKNEMVLYQDYPGDFLTAFNGNVWPSTIFAQPTGWPAWTAGEGLAYADIPRYADWRTDVGCDEDVCPAVREYYSSDMATCTAPTYLINVLSGLKYESGHGYTSDEFDRVRAQLRTELAYERGVASLCGYVKQLTDAQQTTLKQQLIAVGANIDSSLQQKVLNAQMSVGELSRFANIISVGSLIPGVGGAFSAISTVLNAGTSLVSVNSGIPDGFRYTLAELQNRNETVFGPQLTMLTTNLFTAIADDWGKLSVIGAAVQQQRTPWYFCANCDNARPPLTAIPTIALGAKREYYQTLLPTAFDIDLFTEFSNPDPRQYKRDISIHGTMCIAPYRDFPTKSYWDYPALFKPATYDIYVLNEKARKANYAISASSELLDDLLDAPIIDDSALTLSGGAGVAYNDLIRADSKFTQRGYYQPGWICK
jgi:hypothetical protein